MSNKSNKFPFVLLISLSMQVIFVTNTKGEDIIIRTIKLKLASSVFRSHAFQKYPSVIIFLFIYKR